MSPSSACTTRRSYSSRSTLRSVIDTTSSVPSGNHPMPLGWPGTSTLRSTLPSRSTVFTARSCMSLNHSVPLCQRGPSPKQRSDASVSSWVMGASRLVVDVMVGRGCRSDRGPERAPSTGWTTQPSSCVPGSARATMHPPKPPPVIRAPYTPGVAAAWATASSITGVDVPYRSRKLAWPASIMAPAAVRSPAWSAAANSRTRTVLADHVLSASAHDRIGDGGHGVEGGRRAAARSRVRRQRTRPPGRRTGCR